MRLRSNFLQKGKTVAYRAVIFVLAVLTALGTAFFVREGQHSAIAANRIWPGVAERRAEDVLMTSQPPAYLDHRVVIVAADDTSVARMGPVSTWTRDIWALTLRRVLAGDPRAVVMDVALDRRTKDRPDDALWHAMVSGGRRVVLGFGYDATRDHWTPDDVRSLRYLERFALTNHLILHDTAASTVWDWPHFDPPVSDFTGSARGVGVFLREPDPDGVLRDARLLYRSHVTPPPSVTAPLPHSVPGSPLNGFDVVLPSLPVAGAEAAFGLDKSDLHINGEAFDIDRRADPLRIPMDHSGHMAIRFLRPAPQNLISFSDIANGDVGPELFRDKIVIFGVTAADSSETDARRTPRGSMPRVEITASAISNILSENFVGRADGRDVFATLLLVGIVAGLLLPRTRVLMVGVAGVCLAVVYLGLAWAVLATGGLLLPVLPVLLMLAISTVLALAVSAVFAAQKRPAEVRV